ncbi:MAG: DEAD/DEAH box helicase, partial [Acidobacteriota bacterium]
MTAMTAPAAADLPVVSFDALNLHPKLLRALEDMDFTEPTPIQRDSIPPALRGRHVLACAATGSGKTAAFLLPILQRLLSRPSRGVTRALILTPTRELAAQIVEHFEKLASHTNLKAAAVFGGVGMGPQERAFRDGVDVIVACPGRLLDHFRQPYARLSGLDVLVLDEVDRMLDMGFLPDVRRVLKHIPKDYEQALFFSATLPKPIKELSRKLLRNPVTLSVERRSAPARGVRQTFWPVLEEQKRLLLLEMLNRRQLDDVLIFTRTKHRANRLADFLTKNGISADRIHGNRSQAQRTRSLAQFKAGKVQVLVATDIAARGIDVSELSHVVNFDIPNLPEDYIHRVGRTARAGATGDALTFITPLDDMHVRAIERAVGRTIDRVKLEGFDYTSVPKEKLEIELKERLARHRAARQKGRRNAAEKAARKAGQKSGQKQGQKQGQKSGRKTAGSGQ